MHTQGVALIGGETLYLTVPSISHTTSHPFSVAGVEPLSTPSQKGQVAVLHAKATGGDWTTALRAHALLKPQELLPLKVSRQMVQLQYWWYTGQ